MQAELPTSMELQAIKNLKQIAREEFILPGTFICGGCGGLEALRLAAKVLGPKLDFGHGGHKPRQQLPWVTIGRGSFFGRQA